jgi:hypothetical protein
MSVIHAVVLMSFVSLFQEQRSIAEAKMCPDVFAILPSKIASLPTPALERYELRHCPGGEIQVVGWARGASTAELVFNTGDHEYRVLFHKFNVLVLQTLGGASDHVFVFAFESGIPKLVLKTATKDEITVRGERSGKQETVVVEVPPTTYPNGAGEFPPTPEPKVHRFAVEF